MKLTESFNQFHGLQPALGHRQSTDVGILRGRNFRYQLSGPYSGWGNRVVTQAVPRMSYHPWVATFNIDDTAFLFTPEGVYRHCKACAPWELVLDLTAKCCVFTDDHANDWPWSHAMVGNTHYFAHPTVGIVKYDRAMCAWGCVNLKHTPEDTSRFKEFNLGEPLDIIAAPIYAITQSNNRLIVLAHDTVSWSAVDNGDYLVNDIHKGSGFQSLSMNKYGRPLGLHPTQNGFNVYTTNGITTFSILPNEASFRVDYISTEYVPINPYAIVSTPDKRNVYVSRSGIYTTTGQSFPTQEKEHLVVGKWLAEKELPRRNLLNDHRSLRMFYLPETRELFVSMRPQHTEEITHEYLYTRSLVFHEDYGQWASFDQMHFFIGPVNTFFDQQHGYRSGFIGYAYELHHFDNSRFNGRPDYGLDSYIQVGFIHAREQQYSDRQTELQQVTLHTGPMMELLGDREFDTLPLPIDQYEEKTEIWSNYDVLTASSFDGYTVPNQQWDHPVIIDQHSRAQNYACDSMGIGHIIMLSASTAGQFYEVNRIDVQLYVSTIA